MATVSRVLNDSGPVREETRARVWSVAKSLRYVPNEAARTLIRRTTETLGVILPDLYGEFYSEVIRGIDQGAQRHGYHLLLSGSHNDHGEITAAFRAMHRRVDGLVIMSPDADPAALEAELPPSLPVVLLNCPAGRRLLDSIIIDNYGGAVAMVRHLLAHGRRRIVFLTGPARNHDAAERQRGYHDALAEAGVPACALELAGDFTERSGHAAALALLESGPLPDALFAANDAMAVGALSALAEAGVAVPGTLAVVGFDDIPIARYLTPPLTSVRVPIAELGERALLRLLEAVRAGSEHVRRREVLATELVIRRSCGAAAA